MPSPAESLVVKTVTWQEAAGALLEVRRAVFVVEQGVAEEREIDEHDAGALHFLAVAGAGQPVATARLLPCGRVGRVAVLKSARRSRVGSALMEAVHAAALARGHSRLRLHAQVSSIPFYESLGYAAHGAVFDEEGISHRHMEFRIGGERLS